MKYRKKLIVVEAIQYTDDNLEDILSFTEGFAYFVDSICKLLIKTSEGAAVVAEKGDYIVKDSYGEFYSCEPDIFEEIYEAINTNDDYIKIESKRPWFKTYSEEPTLENTEDGDMVWYKDELYIRSGDSILIPQKLNRI